MHLAVPWPWGPTKPPGNSTKLRILIEGPLHYIWSSLTTSHITSICLLQQLVRKLLENSRILSPLGTADKTMSPKAMEEETLRALDKILPIGKTSAIPNKAISLPLLLFRKKDFLSQTHCLCWEHVLRTYIFITELFPPLALGRNAWQESLLKSTFIEMFCS